MEKYYKVSDVNEIIKKLIKEPGYQHEGEDFYAGVYTVEDALTDLKEVALEEPKVARWETQEVEAFWIQNMEESLKTGKPTKSKLPVCSHCKKEFGRIAFDFQYCPNCGAKIMGEFNG